MRSNWTRLLGSSALIAMAFAGTQVQAQSAPTGNEVVNPPAATAAEPRSADSDAAIIVTGTRIRSGFTAPTPTKVLGAEQLNERALSNVGEFLNEVPSFRPSQTAQSNTQNSRSSGQNFADLRALGSIRTLTLVNSRRFVPSTPTGQVDLNLIPTSLISRIDVVTGGASAAYGSDAVAGVVNLILDTKLKGFKADFSYGVSQEGDAEEKKLALAYGTSFGGDRGHVVIGGEYVSSSGVDNFFERDWGRRQSELVSYVGARPAGAPSRFYADGVQALNYAYGGVILGNNADTTAANGVDVLRGIQFGSGGTVIPFPYGTVIGTSAIDFTGGNPGLYARNSHQLVIPVSRRVAMFSLDYKLSDGLTLFAEGNYGRSTSRLRSPSVRDTTATAALILRANAFLPAQIATLMDANGIASFGVGRQYNDFGAVRAISQNETKRIVAGFTGELGGKWTYDAYFQYGHNAYDLTYQGLRIEQNFRFALDSILLSGQAVCRDVTARAQGCVPINIFGEGSPSQAAIAYVNGTATLNIATDQQVAAANLQGEPFATWAGPVGVAFGVEYRKEKAEALADPISNAGGFNYGNARAFKGDITVKEAYAEATVPLARDVAMLHKLDLNGAVRLTDYSTTGGVTTWKFGATWEPVAGVLVRASRSRDIRAPNISDLFAVSTARATLTNPFNGASGQITVVSEPSPTLSPEKADTTTVGVVFSPDFAPGLNISVDYYNITINGAIATFQPQQLLDGCFAEVTAGAAGYNCSFLTRTGTGAATAISSISAQLLNIAQLKTSGVDFDVSYRFPLGGGQLTARLSGNYAAHLISDDGQGVKRTFNAAGVITTVGSIVDRAGQLGGFTGGANVGATSIPRWSLNGQITYAVGALTTTVAGRYFSSGTLDNTLVGPGDPNYDAASPISIGSNRVKGAFYLNLSAAYDIIDDGERKIQLYGLINNLLNRAPSFPLTAVSGMFDRIGRSFKVGVRADF